MIEEWAFHDVSPPYIQLIKKNEYSIYKGEFTAGQVFPSCRVMAMAIHFNPNTVSKAYRILKDNQLIVIIKGRYFVNSDVSIWSYHRTHNSIITKCFVWYAAYDAHSSRHVI